ncbi:FliO/MopB family protein [Aquabacterium sp. OR-4]|uniref:FliO/MopB family protein n=1 Tax=Aquabacterium sp. OR-4 TaxID=2978127 RepID=UPI0021B2CF5E|nr:flagellar biosynthetic protein FliO [Aquabacterium sp. OR-4]MDT7836585.1 flagellar biosynthetic protein FliO [Aquabacterium sp. OR-4]
MSSTAFPLLGPLLAFVLIVALIPLSLWLVKRSPLGARLGVGTGPLPAAAAGQQPRLLGALALAPGQRVVTVEVGAGDERRWLVLGVSAAGIHTLHTLPPGAPPASDPTAATGMAGSFAQLLARQPGGRDAR